MKRPQGNLLDWLRGRRKPKPQMMEISMSDYNKLISLINTVAAAYKEALAKIASQDRDIQRFIKEGENYNKVIHDMMAEKEADEAKKAEGIAILEGLLAPAPGGSTMSI